MSILALHPRVAERLQALASRPPHALLIHAPIGAGKHAVVIELLGTLLAVTPDRVEQHPYGFWAGQGDKAVGIETIRELLKHAVLKTIGKPGIRRFAVIEQADRLTTEAQNSLLKLLEEPPEDMIIILTAANLQSLLPTIRSRCQQFEILVPDKQATIAHMTAAFPQTKTPDIARLYALSGGLPGLLFALLQNDTSHPLTNAINTAKAILAADSFERLVMVDRLAKQKDDLPNVLFGMRQIADISLSQAAARTQTQALKRWHRVLSAVDAADSDLQGSAQTKLALTNLMLHL